MSWIINAGDGTEGESKHEAQIKMGVEVEMEHAHTIRWIFDNITGPETKMPDGFIKNVAKKIAEDHLAELDDYYTKLKDMESSAEKE